jgi:hypothetical protein
MMQTAYAKTFNRSRGRVVSMYMGVVNWLEGLKK